MAKDNDLSYGNKSLSPDESDSNKSFVKKVTSRVSGFIPSSLSKWFSNSEGSVRPRDDSDDEEDSLQIQPPAKRAKTNDSAIPEFNTNNVHPASINNKVTSLRPSASGLTSTVCFPEPIAGPSGITCRKQLGSSKSALNANLYTPKQTDIRNCDKSSDSGESTSGYSSMRVGSKELVTENGEQTKVNSAVASPDKSKSVLFNTTAKVNRSLFNDRTASPQMNTSLSSRQPSFNSTVFGSPNFVDRTLSSKKILDSPFYSGRTTYGGASAYARRLARTSPGTTSLPRNSIQIKPVNEKRIGDSASLSKTARRILDTLEQYTTPIADVKKIPNPPKRAAKYAHVTPYSIRDVKIPSNRELQVPTVPDLLKMKLKNKMQNTTVSVRQIATSSKSTLNNEDYHIAEDSQRGKHSNKIKDKLFSFKEKPKVCETVEEVNLPDIQLPITTLPVFNFTLPAASASVVTTNETITTTVKKITEKSVEVKKTEQVVKETVRKDSDRTEQSRSETNRTELAKQTEYMFSNPVVLSENKKHVKAINNFIFSEPISTKDSVSAPKGVSSKNNGDKLSAVKEPIPKPTTNGSAKFPLPDNKISNSFGDKFKPAADTWECSMCMIRNLNNVTACVACSTPKPGPAVTKQENGFGEQFKKKDSQWECESCMVRNSSDKLKCLCCDSPKPGSTNNKNVKFPLPEIKVSTFGDKFKPAADSWECSVCMIRNKNDTATCVACNSSKPGYVPPKQNNGFGDQFKKKNDQWECDSCMIRNSTEHMKCMCCDAPKAGLAKRSNIPKETKPMSTFNFGVVNNADMQFSFGIKPSENKPLTSTPSIFGQAPPATFGQAAPSASPTFTFGIKPAESKTVESITPIVEKPAAPPVESTFKATTEAPIIPAKSTLNGEVKETPTLFGNTTKPDQNDNVKKDLPKTPMFSFGAKPTEPTATLPVFGASKPVVTTSPTSLFTTNTTSTIAKPTFGSVSTVFGTSAAPATPATFSQKRSTESDEAPPAKAPMFAFGQTAKKEDEPSKITFGSTPNNSTFTFGQTGSQPTTGGFNFGAAPLNPPVATSQNGAFQFGSASTAPAKPTFNFGGSSQPQAQPGTGMFNFGSAAPAPSGAAGGFNFASNTEIKPNFNFNAGAPPPNFGAGSSNVGPEKPRVMRRGLRRTTRR